MIFHKDRTKQLLPDLELTIPDNYLVWAISCHPYILSKRIPWRFNNLTDMRVLRSLNVCPCSLWFHGAKPSTNFTEWTNQVEMFYETEPMEPDELTGNSVTEIAERLIFEKIGRSLECPCVIIGMPDFYPENAIRVSRRRI